MAVVVDIPAAASDPVACLLTSSESLLLLFSCWGLYCCDLTAMTSLLLLKLKFPDVVGSTAVTGFPTFTCVLMLASLLLVCISFVAGIAADSLLA